MDFNHADDRLTIEAEAITWMAIHGNLLLALRHPQNTGPSGKVTADFVTGLGELLVKSGLMSREDLDNTLAIERLYMHGGRPS